MLEFNIRFSRYKNGTRLISGVSRAGMTDFNGAVQAAKLILKGMEQADPKAEFQIAEIKCTSYSLGCEVCEDGWETEEDREAQRVEAARDHQS